jgi:hypothetical protein
MYIQTGFRQVEFAKKAFGGAADPSAYWADIALKILIECISDKDCPFTKWQVFRTCLKMLQNEGFEIAGLNGWNNVSSSSELLQGCVAEVVRVLITAGANLEWKSGSGMNPVSYFIYVYLGLSQRKTNFQKPPALDYLSVLIEVGVSVHGKCRDGLTPSMYARGYDLWEEWCEALERNGKNIEKVVQVEGSSWLLGEDWMKIWKSKGYWYYRSSLLHEEYGRFGTDVKDDNLSDGEDGHNEEGDEATDDSEWSEDDDEDNSEEDGEVEEESDLSKNDEEERRRE